MRLSNELFYNEIFLNSFYILGNGIKLFLLTLNLICNKYTKLLKAYKKDNQKEMILVKFISIIKSV